MEARSRPSWVPDDLYPFEDHWAEIDGNLVHYVDEGAGAPLLLLNGNPSWSFGYRNVITRLRDRFRCIAPDYPGFGLSRARPDYDFKPASHSRVIEALIEQLGLEALTVMGYDWGGPIGLGVAGRRPEWLRALVIGNTFAGPADSNTLRVFSALVGGPVSWLLVGRLNLLLNVFLPGGLRRRKLTDRELLAYRGPFPPGRRGPMQVLPREIVGSRAYLHEVETNLARLSQLPALILWADSDPAFRTRERERFERLFPRHRTVILRNVGHYLEEDAPHEVAEAIADWWSEEVVDAGWPAGP